MGFSSNIFLRFVSPTDDIKSCSFVQTMEQRLENVFSEAQEKVDDTYGILTVEILNTYQTGNSLAVSLVYVVWNGSSALNGTVATGLVNQLTAELVGYFLFFPPMLIAERKFLNDINKTQGSNLTDVSLITGVE
uniref:SEA domain-containing protein n=1 Tax=Electrophorus electricus TaxID=8005 RepID=A0A4W4ERY3_ELEEL